MLYAIAMGQIIIVYYAKRQKNTYLHKYNFAIFACFVNWY